MSLSKIYVNTQDTGFEGIPLQNVGNSTTIAMSQKTTTDCLANIDFKLIENINQYVVNGFIDERTGEIKPNGYTLRMTLRYNIYTKYCNHFRINQTALSQKLLWGYYTWVENSEIPTWHSYTSSNIIDIKFSDDVIKFNIIIAGPNDLTLSPDMVADVIFETVEEKYKTIIFDLLADTKPNVDYINWKLDLGSDPVIRTEDNQYMLSRYFNDSSAYRNVDLSVNTGGSTYKLVVFNPSTPEIKVISYTDLNINNDIVIMSFKNNGEYGLKNVSAAFNFTQNGKDSLVLDDDNNFRLGKNLNKYVFNGKINEETGQIEINSQIRTRMTINRFFYTEDVKWLRINQTALQTKLSWAYYTYTNTSGIPIWHTYSNSNIIDIKIPESNIEKFDILIAGPNDIQISPTDIADVIFSYPELDNSMSFQYTTFCLLADTEPNVDLINKTFDLGSDPIIFLEKTTYRMISYFDNPTSYRNIDLSIDVGASSYKLVTFNPNIPEIRVIGYDLLDRANEIILLSFKRAGSVIRNISAPFSFTVNGNSSSDSSIKDRNADVIDKIASAARSFHNDESGSTVAQSPLMLLHFSDIHSDSVRLDRLIAFRNTISNYLDDTLHTGDVSNYPDSLNFWSKYADTMLNCNGNHEYFIEKVDGSWRLETPLNVYNKFIAPFKDNWTGTVFPNDADISGKSYYYKDYDSKYVRLIVLDYMEIERYSSNSTQLTWLEATLAETLDNTKSCYGYHIVIALHIAAFIAEQNYLNPFDSLDFKSNKDGIVTSSVPNTVETFINNGGKFVCYLTGHNHIDHFGVGINYPHQLNITIGCAIVSAGGNTMDIQRVVGERSEDLFNIVAIDTYSSILKLIRVGADLDRNMRKKDMLCYYYGNDSFDANKSYAVGKIVVKDEKVYQFTANHSGNWTGNDACEINRLIKY